MGKPLVDLPDAERKMIDALEAAGYGTVKTEFPSESLGSEDEWIQVDLESSNVDDYPVTERGQVRVTAHLARGRRTAVKRLMSDVIADVYTYADSEVAGIVPLTGRSAVSTDPDNGNVMCWALFRVDLLASNAS